MKKLLCIILALIISVSAFPAVLAADAGDGKVEISFKVGDSTLLINGSPVTVETPYVAGDGTTLVPLRVITEAFGAKVTWEGETQSVYLEYPDVNITLKIGSREVIVNTHSETLPVAPELSASGVTMVPLRFISETFGAVVSYDNDTKSITVVKDTVQESATIGSGTINDKPRVGDSFYGWSMNTPAGMMMTNRRFDGTYTIFTDESGAILSVYIFKPDDDLDFDTDYSKVREVYSSNYTLTQADKFTDEFGNPKMHFKARTKEIYEDFITTLKDGLFYDVTLTVPLDSENIPVLTAIVDSFTLSFGDAASTHDLSTVENGYRLFTDDEFKVSFKVPAECSLDEESGAVNKFYFSGPKDSHTRVSLSVYSKSETVTSALLSARDNAFQRAYSGPEFVSVSNVFNYEQPIGDNAFYYVIETKSLPGGDYEARDIFFEKGYYVYNLTIGFPKGKDSIVSTVVDSFKAEELDKNVIGMLLETEYDRKSTYTSSAGNWTMQLPVLWQEVGTPTADSAIYIHKLTGDIFSLTSTTIPDMRAAEKEEFVTEYFDSVRRKTFDGLVQRSTYNTYGKNGLYSYTGYIDNDNGRVYVTLYLFFSRNRMYQFALHTDAYTYNCQTAKDVEEILTSFDIS